jgi:diaminopropionate ammonia-lyase
MTRVHRNRPRPAADALGPVDPGDPRAFHRTLPGYRPTPVHRLRAVEATLGLGEVWVKDESSRLGLPSFKILCGAWAVHRLVMHLAGQDAQGDADGRGLDELRRAAAALGPRTLCTATDGNHGRGVARMARLLGWDAVVIVPDDMVPARIHGIRGEGARVVVHPGDYDAAVARAAEAASQPGWELVADVAGRPDDQVPGWVMDGYDTIFAECDEQLPGPPTTLLVQAGVGALAGGAVRHYLAAGALPKVGIVEPLQAACLLESARAGHPVSLASSQGSIMAGLNCGTPSQAAWPYVAATAEVFLAVGDEAARQAMRLLAAAGIEAGESGAAGLAGLLEAARHPEAATALGLGRDARVLLVNTEGATDPAAYRQIVGAARPDHQPTRTR